MRNAGFRNPAIALAFVTSLALSGSVTAGEAQPGWAFSVMPYLWVPGVDAELRYGPPPPNEASANVDADDEDVLSKIEGVFMIAAEARNGQWIVFTDYLYLHLADVSSTVKSVDFNPGSGPINVSTSQIGGSADSSFKGSVWAVAGGYGVWKNAMANLEMFAGLRRLDLEFASDWDLNADVTLPNSTQTFARSGSTERKGDVTTLILGAKGNIELGKSEWFIPYYADLGNSNSTSNWQLATGLGYRFHWGDVRLDYRHLAYEQDDDKLLHDIALSGFALGADFSF
ncbi:MAG TPA: hypothetical protein VM553_04180 [Dongiaceae bacterium]|nr:hypothetical protein [Dongiaceae bacterium]